MTDDRIFKNKVKEVAELNGLSYTEAKKAVITINQSIENLVKSDPLLWNSAFQIGTDYSSNFTNVIIREPAGKFIQTGEVENIPQYVELSRIDKDYSINLAPLNGVKRGLSNVSVAQYLDCTNKEIARLTYFAFAEKFDKESIYFVDKENYFYQMPKVIKALKERDENEEVLLGVIKPSLSDDQRSLSSKYEAEIEELMMNKTVYAIVYNFSILEQQRNFSSEQKPKFFTNIKTNVKYYPFDKLHGGSYHRSTSKLVLGHTEGNPEFISAPVSLIEKDDNSCIEEIHQLNKDKAEFLHWETSDDMKNSIQKDRDGFPVSLDGKTSYFIQIDFEMDEKDFEIFFNLIYSISTDYRYDKHYTNKIIIETPDAERMQSHYQDISERFNGFTTRYLMVDDDLYSESGKKVSLYKV